MLTFSISPPCALNVTLFPAAATCDAAIHTTHVAFIVAERNFQLTRVRNKSANCSLVLGSRLGHGACMDLAFGGATDSSAPESTTASTEQDPALGVSLATAHTDLVSPSFIGYWTRGTRVSTILEHRYNLFSFSFPGWKTSSLCSSGSRSRAWQCLRYHHCRALPELQTCLSHPFEAQAEPNVFLILGSKHPLNQVTTHRQLFLRSDVRTLFSWWSAVSSVSSSSLEPAHYKPLPFSLPLQPFPHPGVCIWPS